MLKESCSFHLNRLFIQLDSCIAFIFLQDFEAFVQEAKQNCGADVGC